MIDGIALFERIENETDAETAAADQLQVKAWAYNTVYACLAANYKRRGLACDLGETPEDVNDRVRQNAFRQMSVITAEAYAGACRRSVDCEPGEPPAVDLIDAVTAWVSHYRAGVVADAPSRAMFFDYAADHKYGGRAK